MVQMQEYKQDDTLRAILEKEKRDDAQKRAAYEQWHTALQAEAERSVRPISPAAVLTAFERGDDLDAWYPEKAANLAAAKRAVEAMEAEAEGLDPGDVYKRGQLKEKLEPLRTAEKDAREVVKLCRAIVQDRIRAALDVLDAEQVKQRDLVLAKAVPFEERLGEFGRVRQHFGVVSMGTRIIGVARWLAHE